MTLSAYDLSALVMRRIVATRKARGLSRSELAYRADLSLQWVNVAEKYGVRNPGIFSLGRISEALGVPLHWLVSEHADLPDDMTLWRACPSCGEVSR